jgi:hypothetical protein
MDAQIAQCWQGRKVQSQEVKQEPHDEIRDQLNMYNNNAPDL